MKKELKQIRSLIIFFMLSLFLSGLTAIPLETELVFLSRCFSYQTPVGPWLEKVRSAISYANSHFPFLAYGYDWLAFAHFILAILFIGPLKDPVKNKWVVEFGMIACVLIIPFALIAGHFRAIPVGWRLIDCSFGVLGLIPLSVCRSKINCIENLVSKNASV